jgi:monofunctional biosynthetic peptidoglycan transglycosylase
MSGNSQQRYERQLRIQKSLNFIGNCTGCSKQVQHTGILYEIILQALRKPLLLGRKKTGASGMGKRKGRILRILLKWVLYLVILYFGITFLSVILYRFINPPFTPLMIIRAAGQIAHGEPVKLKKHWVPLDGMSLSLPLAVVSSEDNRFLEHHGFDMEAIEKAQDYNERYKGKKFIGASTISQQTAKNVFLWPQRSWLRKGLEVYFTFLIELIWNKKRILEVYLNVIEMGKGIYGVEEASQLYFGKTAVSLNRSESAMLAAILPNPLRWDPRFPTNYLLSRQEWILWNMENIGKLDF